MTEILLKITFSSESVVPTLAITKIIEFIKHPHFFRQQHLGLELPQAGALFTYGGSDEGKAWSRAQQTSGHHPSPW